VPSFAASAGNALSEEMTLLGVLLVKEFFSSMLVAADGIDGEECGYAGSENYRGVKRNMVLWGCEEEMELVSVALFYR
jgi:hypothetical protein